MSVLDRKLRRELRTNAALLVAVASIIVVGVACFVTLSSSYRNLNDAKRRYYAQCQMADFSVELKKVPVSELFRLREMPEVTQIRPRIQFYAPLDLPGVEEPLNGQIISLPDRRQPMLNDILVQQGSYFTDRRENEVIVNDSFARYYRLRPGQWIRVLLNNRQQELFIVGTAISAEFVYLLGSNSITPDPKHFGVLYLKQSYAEEVFDFKGSCNQVLGQLSGAAHGDSRAVLRRAESSLAAFGVFTTTPLEDQISNRFLSQEIQGLRSFSVISPSMFVLVAAMVLNVLLTRLAEHQRTVVGTFKALGYSDAQVFFHFLKFGLSVGLTGGLVGCGLGYYLAGGMASMYREFFNFPDLYNRPYVDILATGMLISAGCAVLGSFWGCRAVLRLHPAEAMRPKPPRQGKGVLLERVVWFWSRLNSSWRMVLRNLIRNRVRTGAAVFAAMMGSSVLVNSFMFFYSPWYLLDFQFKWVLRSDLDLHFKDERGIDALNETAGLPGVDRAEPVLSVACTFYHGAYSKKGSVTGLQPGAQLTVPRTESGAPIGIPRSGVTITRTLADILHIEPGQTLFMEPIKGLRRRIALPVVAVSDSYLGLSVYSDLRYLSRLLGEEFAVTGVQLALDQNPEHRRALYRELKQMPGLQAVAARRDMVQSLEDTVLRNQWVIINLLVTFAGIVFFGSILNASLVSLAERQRELATLRVLGYGPWRIGSLLLRESGITTIVGAILGMPLGYLLTRITAAEYASDMFRLPIITAPSIWIWTIVLAIVFWLVAHLAVQRKVHQMDWLDALKVSE